MKNLTGKVVTATLADHSFIVEAQLKMALETENLSLDPSTVEKGVLAVLQDEHKGQYYVFKGDDLKTYGCLLTIPEWSDWRNGKVLWIHSVYVSEEARGNGIYKKMYEFLKEKVLEDKNLRGLRLYVDKTNLRAEKVYQKCGMSNEHYSLYEWMKS